MGAVFRDVSKGQHEDDLLHDSGLEDAGTRVCEWNSWAIGPGTL